MTVYKYDTQLRIKQVSHKSGGCVCVQLILESFSEGDENI